MLQQLVLRLRPQSVNCLLRRNIAASAAVYAKGQNITPVQQLFVDKIREYAKQGSSMLDKDPELKKEMEAEKARLNKMYGGGDLSQFPDVKFNEIDFAVAGKS